MIDLFKVNMSFSAERKVSEVLQSGYVTQGPKVEEFEDLLWSELRSPHRPILTNSCTNAIDLALELCGVVPEKYTEVISTPQTCFATNVGIIHRNARIRWADIDPITGLIDPVSVGKLINENTSAIIAVNWSGKFADYAALKQFGIPVIEDAAHTWDTFTEKFDIVERGDYICYSLQAIKFLTAGDGGILITPLQKENEARLLRWYGLDRTKNESFRITQNIKRAGYKYNMNDISAAIGMSNISNANNAVVRHKENAKILCDKLMQNHNIIIPEFDENSSYWIFPIIVNNNRDEFIEYLKQNNIMAALVHYRNDKYDSTKMFEGDALPGVDFFTNHQVNIPCGWWLSDDDLNHIINVVLSWGKVV